MDTAQTTLHIFSLIALLYWGLRPMRHDIAATISALFLLTWADLVSGALILGCFGELGNRNAYVLTTLIIAMSIAWLIRRTSYETTASVDINRGHATRTDQWVRRFSWFAILVVSALTAIICTFYVANNFDSVAYRFPRALFYIEQGSLNQVLGDPRIQFYPFDISLVYVWFAIHNLGGAWFNLFGYVSWLVGGFAVWRFSRDIGAGPTSALLAAAIFITAPAVLVSASSTNDDMIAGIPLLIGVMFLVRWWKSASWIDAMLAALGLGLSAGSKLHIAMMAPIGALLVLSIAYRLFRAGDLRRFARSRRNQVLSAILLVSVLALPVFVINYRQAGALVFDAPGFQNSPFSIVAAGVHAVVSSASMFLGPIPDLYLARSQEARKSLGDTFNTWANDRFFSWVTPDLHYSYEPYFYFDGVVSNAAHLGVNEVSVWLGFIPWLLVLVIILSIRQRPDHFRNVALWLALAFFTWHLTRCLQLKYVRGEGIYYAFAMALAAPALAWLWEYGAKKGNLAGTLMRGICVVVLLANLVSAANYFAFNYQRRLPNLLASHFQPNRNLLSPQFSNYLKESRRTLIIYSQWELPYFQFMTEQPSARYATATDLHATQDERYDLAFVLGRDGTDIPVVFANDDRTRLSLLGTAVTLDGKQRVFGAGTVTTPPVSKHDVDRAGSPKGESTFAVLRLNQQRDEKGGLVSIRIPNIFGIDKNEELAMSITLVTRES